MAGALVILAHPDDEFFCAGALSAMVRSRIPLTVVYWTRGEGGLRRRFKLPTAFRSLFPFLPAPRVREASRSMDCLGIHDVFFMPYRDPRPRGGLKEPEHEASVLRAEIAGWIAQTRPELILSHGSNGEYGHPAHAVLHQRIRETLEARNFPTGFVTFAAARPDCQTFRLQNASDRADAVLDTLPYAQQKRAVLESHRSQKKVWLDLIGSSCLDEALEMTRFEYYNMGGCLPGTLATFLAWTGSERL